jgi:hypothetical protein
METTTQRPSTVPRKSPVPTSATVTGPTDDRRAARRIPDLLAALSYGTRVLAPPGSGPRIL